MDTKQKYSVTNKKNTKIRILKCIIVAVLFSFVVFLIKYRENIFLYFRVTFCSWTTYHKEFDLKSVKMDSERKEIELHFTYKANFTDDNLQVSARVYRDVKELFFEKMDNYEQYTISITFRNSSLGEYFEIDEINSQENGIALKNHINLELEKIAESFPEVSYLELRRLQYDSIEELALLQKFDEVSVTCSCSEEEKEYLKLHYPELYIKLGLKGDWKYEETSDISALAVDNIAQYNMLFTDCELYQWSEEVVLPFPAPDAGMSISVGGESEPYIVVKDIDASLWESYVQTLSELYISEVHVTEMNAERCSVYDEKNNFMAELVWQPDEKCMDVQVMMFCQQGVSMYSNEEIAELVISWEEVEADDIKAVINISSNSNLEEGFDVYYIWMEDDSVTVSDYFCVIHKDSVAILEEARVGVGNFDEIEFYSKGDVDYMVLLTCNENGEQILEIYEDSGYFELQKTVKVADLESVKNRNYTGLVTLEKDVDGIHLYKIEQHAEGIPYTVGERIE